MSKEPVRRKKAATAALDPAEVAAIVSGQHGDPFAVLGVQGSGSRLVARAFVDGAAELEAFTLDGTPAGTPRAPARRRLLRGPAHASASASR